MPTITEEIFSALKMFCKKIYPITLSELERTLLLLKEFPSINSRDAIHAATMLNNGIKKILSTDPHFDLIKGIERIEP